MINIPNDNGFTGTYNVDQTSSNPITTNSSITIPSDGFYEINVCLNAFSSTVDTFGFVITVNDVNRDISESNTKEFVEFISNVWSIINFVAIDFSVCTEFSFTDLMFLLKNLQQDDLSVYIDGRYLDTLYNNTLSSNEEYAKKYQNINIYMI